MIVEQVGFKKIERRNVRMSMATGILAFVFCAALVCSGEMLPGQYYRLMEAGIAQADASALKLEQRTKSHSVPGALMVASVLYAKAHPDNPRAGDPAMLALALKLGDLLAAESESGVYTKRSDHHRDTYMWLEAFRLLGPKLGDQRRARWRRELLKLIGDLAASAAERQDRAAYTSAFGVSVNHTALYSAAVHLAGRVFGKREWERLGAKILHRYAAAEQSRDGYWGEHSPAGPTTAYDYLTVAGVSLYWEHSQDPAALNALRRSTNFHKYFTYPDGYSVMILDDRRRHAYVSPWGHFGFSHFPDGRRYAEFLAGFSDPRAVSFEHLGRLAQDALYYHEGPAAPIPQDQERYVHQMSVPAGIRKTGPWVVCLSGLISTQAATSRYYLDRQSSLEIFHEKTGLIISGANSKRQPELATFQERIQRHTYHMPLDSRLRMSDVRDRLSLAYNTFVSDLEVDPPSAGAISFRFLIQPKDRPEDANLTLQLVLKPDETLETGGGRKVRIGADPINWEAKDLGGWIRHRGWTLNTNSAARVAWPVFPYNPYADGPETSLEYAVGTLSVPLELEQRQPKAIKFTLEVSPR